MESYAYYNGIFGKRDEIRLPLSDRTIFFGDAVYDAALFANGNIVWENEHIDRFFKNCETLYIPVNFTKDELKAILRETAKKSNFSTSFIYFQLSRNLENRRHSAHGCQSSNLLITVEKFTLDNSEKKLSLITFPDKRYEYCNIKTVNLLPSVLAASEAERKECDEAVFVRDGIVTECSRSNIFILKDGKVKTHPADNRILPGIARQKIILACKRLGIEVSETSFPESELFDADEILVSCTTKLCLGATSLNGSKIGDKCPEIRRKIYGELYKDLVVFGSN